jgi:predicted Co/Zn/Cd cation transporter (cation efflux family)
MEGIMQKKIEQKALIISSVINFIMAAAGIWVFSVTKIQAIFIDGVFSLIGLISLILAAVLSKESRRKTKSYPDGLVFLEPLYAILKSQVHFSV